MCLTVNSQTVAFTFLNNREIQDFSPNCLLFTGYCKLNMPSMFTCCLINSVTCYNSINSISTTTRLDRNLIGNSFDSQLMFSNI